MELVIPELNECFNGTILKSLHLSWGYNRESHHIEASMGTRYRWFYTLGILGRPISNTAKSHPYSMDTCLLIFEATPKKIEKYVQDATSPMWSPYFPGIKLFYLLFGG